MGNRERALTINPASVRTYNLQESLTYENELVVNRIWYSADASMIEQIMKKMVGSTNGADVASGRFWSASPMSGLAIRKIHSGLPAQTVNVLTDLIVGDMGPIKFSDERIAEIWEKMQEDIDIGEAVHEAVSNTLVDGDGAYKIYYDSSISDYPLIDYYSGDSVECEYNGRKLLSVTFFTSYTYDKKTYELREKYTKGRIDYELYDNLGKRVPIKSIPYTADLSDYIEFALPVILAVPCMFFKSTKHPGRGKSIYDGKWECYDALDEAISAWRDAERDNRTKNYIPEDLIPRDEKGGELLQPNPFQFRFITLSGSVDLGDDKIQTSAGKIDYEAHQRAIASCLDLCLQGIISPATLGINVAADSSGESQREKKDITAITRNHITAKLEKVVKKLLRTVMDLYLYYSKTPHADYNVDFSFGEYGALDFGGRIEMLSKAAPGQSVMSTETIVEELWGDSKDDNWKAAEVERIKAESSVAVDETPFPSDDTLEDDSENEDKVDYVDMTEG